MGAPLAIRAGQSTAADPATAVREFHAAVDQPDAALVLFFCSSDYDLDALASELRAQFNGVAVVGCTTAGEIGPAGYQNGSLSGASFASASFTAVSGLLGDLQTFTIDQGQTLVGQLRDKLDTGADVAATNTFGFLLIDGLSVREEPVVRTLHYALGGVPLFGGSAADGLRFGVTHVYHGGRFHTDSAVLTLVATELPFRVFKTQHFAAETERLVVTGADPARRVVREINGLPAAEEYARIVGVPINKHDQYGHLAGDACLRRVAATLAANVRGPTDVVARYGGEEFSAILPGADEAQALVVGERLRAAVARLAEPHLGMPLGIVTISVGTASTMPALEGNPERLLDAADAALYQAKQRGRDQVVGA